MDASRPTSFADGEFRLRLSAQSAGRFQLHLTPFPSGGFRSPNKIDITVDVTPANCAPEIVPLTDSDRLPTVRWNGSNQGLRVSDLASHFYQTCGSSLLHLVVVSAANSSLGRWQWSPNDGDDWTDMIVDVNSSGRVVSRVSLMGHLTRVDWDESILSDALVIPAKHRLRFVPHSSGRQWTRREAMSSARIVFTASVSRSEQEAALRNVSYFNGDQDLSVSRQLSIFYMEFSDCSGHSSDQLKMPDLCGICGGDNSTCSQCATPETECGRCRNVTQMTTRDCAFQCQPLNEIKGSVCVAKTNPLALAHCKTADGEFLNKCGYCVTESDPLLGMNPCGTCSPGPNGPCSPCSRLAGGQCTWSHSWDDGKRPLMDWRPSKIDLMYGNRHTVSIRRAVIPTPPASPSCRLSLIDRPQGGNSSVLNTFSTYGALWLVVQVHDPGAYSVTCTWSVNGTTLTRSGQLNVIDSTLSTAVAEISPRRVPVATTVVVNVTRRSSVNITHGLRCIYQQSGHATFTVAAFGVYGDVVACQLTLGYAVVTHLGLAVGEFPRSATIDQVPGLALQVRAQAPRIVSSALSRSLDHVSISFDQNVEGTSHCPDLFESASLALMGRDFSCTFHGNRLTLSLGLNHHMCPGSRLSFRSPAPIRRQGSAPELASSFQGTDVSVQLTEQILIDPIVILGPNSICPDEIALYRVGGLSEMRSANATFTWQLVKSNKSVTIATGPQLNVLLLNSSLIDSGLGNQLTLQVDLQLCGRTYSLSSSLNVQISAVLSVGITGPSRVYLDRHYFFTASVSTCRASVGLVNYQWSANGTAVASRLNAARIDLPRLLSSRSFYRLTCFVYASDDLNTNGQAEFNFYVDETAIAARISPTAQVVGYDGFTLDGSWSEDTANIPSTRLQFIWRCQRSDGGGCYVARRGPLERLEQLVGLIDLQKPVLRIADVLPPANYTFTLALYKGLGHFSEANATVVVVARNYPQITISDAEGHFVGARVQCSSPCCAYWTVDQETGTNYELIDDASLNSRSVYKPSRFSVPLEIPEFTKRLRHSEMRFRFKLSVKDLETSELTAQATVELLADSNPSGGNFTAESIESLDGLPSVKFKAENWTDQQQYLPLTYRFGYRLVKTNIWLTVMSYENSASLAVPFLTKQNVVPLVTICNAKLLCTQAESRAISVGGGAVQFATVLKESATAVELGHHHAALSLLHSSLVSMGRSFKLENDSRNWILDAVIEPGLLRYKQTRFYDEDQFATREAVQFLSLAFDVMVDAKMVLINAGERILETLEAIDRISRQENRVQRGHLRITNRRSGIPQIDLDRVILGVRLTEWLWMSPTTPKHAKARIMTDLLNYAACCGRRSKTTSVQTESIGLTSRKILLQSDSPHLIPTNETSHSLAYVDLTSIAIGSDNGAICLKIIETKLAPSSQVIRGDSWTRISSAVLIEATDLFGHSENELIPINGVFSASSVQLNSTSKFGCFKWDLTSDQWQSEPSCSATYPSVFVNSSDFVDCTCFRRGFHAVFVSQLVAPRSVWAVRMKIVNDFHETVGQRKVELTDYLLDQLSLILNISVQQFEAARLDRETMLFSFNIAALDETFKVERAFGLLTEFLGSGTLQLMDLNGRLLNIPPQTVDGLLITRDLGLIIFFVALCSFSVMAVIGFVVYKIWRRSNVVAPLKIPSPKSYLYPNSFSNDLSAFQMARPPEDLMFRCKDDLHESKL